MKIPDCSRVFVISTLFLILTVGMASANVIYFTDFSTDPATDGWTGFVANQWEWGPATASSGCSGGQDPAFDHSGDGNIIGYNIGGCYTNNMPEISVTSPAFDCSAYDYVFIDYYRWLGVESATWDKAYVRVSTNGTTWTNVWEHTGSSFWDGAWIHRNYDISAIAAGESTVYVRFVMGTTDSSVVYCGWNIDDFSLIGANDGFLEGIVTNADGPVEGAIVTVLETGESAVTGSNGYYELPHLSGFYTVRCQATGHNDAVETNVEIIEFGTTVLDFVLTYPVLDYTPDSFEVTLDINTTETRMLTLENLGNGPLDYSLSFSSTDGLRNPQAYGIDLIGKTFHAIPDLSTPGTWTQIGGVLTGSYYGGDFINDDFTTLYIVDNDTSQLRTIDTATGVVTTIGPAPRETGHTWTGMTGAADGTMYMSSTDGATSILYTVDITTGNTTQIGPVTNSPLLIDIAISSTGQMYGVDIGSDSLIHINTSTGAGTVIGPIGFDASFAQGMDFDFATDTLYLAAYNVGAGGVAELRIADLTTGNTTLIGPFPPGTEVDAFGITSPASSWVSFDVKEGSIPAGDSFDIEVLFDANEVDFGGTYHGTIILNHNSGDEIPVEIPVTMHVLTDFGVLEGMVTSDNGTVPIEGATITVVGPNYTGQSGPNGSYTINDVMIGTYTVTCTAPGFYPASVDDVVITAGMTTIVDFDLLYAEMDVQPEHFFVNVPVNGTLDETMSVWNTGTADLNWSLAITEPGTFKTRGDFDCDPDSVWSQPWVGDDVYTVSDMNHENQAISADDFNGVTDPVAGIEFWGGELECCWFSCNKTNLDFEITFYEAGSVPGAIVHQETVTTTRITTSEFLFNEPSYGNVKKYTAMLANPVSIESGWVSVQAVDSGACWFLWADGGPTSGTQEYVQNTGTGWAPGGYGVDLAFCLIGAPIAWLSVDPVSGTLNPGEMETLDVFFDANETDGIGTYEAWIVVTSNDPNQSPWNIPVTMNVYDGPTPTPPEPTATPTQPAPTATPTEPGPTPTPPPPPPDFIWIETDYCGDTGDQIDVYIWMSNETVAVDAFTMTVDFDNTMLQYESCIAGDLDPGWTMFGCNEASPGSIIIAGFSLPPDEIPAGSEGALAVLTFTVTCNDCDEGDTSEFVPHTLLDDIAGFGIGNGMFTFICPEPTPTPTPEEPTPTPEPTDTPVPPTHTPTHTPTNTPTHTPTTIPPTFTPTPTPTQPEEPTPTPTQPEEPTPTPEPDCDWFGAQLELSQEDLYRAGEEFWLRCHICVETMFTDVPTAILLGVYGEFWFWPGWEQDFDLMMMDFEPGLTTFYGLEPFIWPTVEGHVEGLEFYAAMLTPGMDNIVGDFGYVVFGYTDL